MQRGLKDIVEQAEKDAQNFSKNRINYVGLRDKELVELRFLTDSEGLIKAKIHTVQETTPKGPRYRKKYCTMQDIGSCVYCSKGDSIKSNIYLWAWVYTVYHAQQNSRLETNPNADKWQAVKLNDGKTYYKETVNGPMVFKISVGQKGVYQNTIVGFARDYGTLIDRNYRVSRTGSNLDTTYNLVPLKEGPMPDELAECMRTLPDLGDVITGKITAFDQDDNIVEDVPLDTDAAKVEDDKSVF
jgi:hypothetical protein